MDLSAPATSVLSSMRAKVLLALAHADDGLTGRGLAAIADTAVSSTARLLESLVEGGLIQRTQVGKAFLYRLNREHLAAGAVLILAEMHDEFLRRLRGQLAAFTHRPVTAVVYGSFANGNGDQDSDIDLLLVRPEDVDEDDLDWVRDVDALAVAAQAWTGNELSVLQYDQHELGEVLRDNPGLSRSLVRGIHVHGKRLPPIQVATRKRTAR